MVRETELTPSHLVLPLFVQLGEGQRTPIEAMPGVERLSISETVAEAGEAHELAAPARLLEHARGLVDPDNAPSGVADPAEVLPRPARRVQHQGIFGAPGDESIDEGRVRRRGIRLVVVGRRFNVVSRLDRLPPFAQPRRSIHQRPLYG